MRGSLFFLTNCPEINPKVWHPVSTNVSAKEIPFTNVETVMGLSSGHIFRKLLKQSFNQPSSCTNCLFLPCSRR
jgi:hypothetical protein